MIEPLETRRKRLYMRSIRRGIKEMDLILTAFADARLGQLEHDALAVYERLLAENDHDLYQWVTAQTETPAEYAPLLADIRAGAEGVVRP